METQILIKTICDFLFFDQYQDTATFSRFEKCFQPLYNNIDISFEKVFKEICGEKKKYITYKRFAKAFLNYKTKKEKEFSEDTKIFFDKLFNSILKSTENFVGKIENDVYSYSTKKISSKRICITKVQVLTDKDGAIRGINIQYDGTVQSIMHPKSIENELKISLEMALNVIDDKSKIPEKLSASIGKAFYNDGITHIFGTLNSENGFITFLGFKCISGKTLFIGFPKGDGFLFGRFGNKLHDLKIQMTDKGIKRLEPGFIQNMRKNLYLDSIKQILSYENLKGDEIIKDEECFNNIKDTKDIDKLTTITIIEDSHFFKESLKDEFCGNDYKEVVDQRQRNWISNTTQSIIEKFKKKESKNFNKDYALDKFNLEFEKAKEKINSDNSNANENLILHKTKAYKGRKKNEFIEPNKSTIFSSSNYKLSVITPEEKKIGSKNKSFLVFDHIQKYQKKLGDMINNEILEKNLDEKLVDEKTNIKTDEKEDDNINNKATKVTMKNLKGEILVLGENNKAEIEKMKNAQEKWKNFGKNLEKINGVYLFQTIGSIIRAKNVLKKNLNISFEEKVKLYDLLDKNKNIVRFLSKNMDLEKIEEEDNDNEVLLIPDLHPEKYTSVEELQKDIDHIKQLLKNSDNLTEEERKKIEKLQNYYIQQKNIIIENQSKQAKEELINDMNINVDKYLQKEEERRAEAMKEEEKKIKNEIRIRKEKAKPRKTFMPNQSFVAKKISTRIFHKQKAPKPFEVWVDEMFPAKKESLCPYDGNDWILFEGLDEDDVESWAEYKWCKLEEIDEEKEYSVFDEEGANINDIMQGDINDCYFLSAIGSLCSFPDFYNKLFHIKSISEEHLYGIYLYINGKWKLVLIDDFFPYNTNSDYVKEFCFGTCCEKELWVSLLEKAWAKVNGCYARIGCRGFSKEAFDVLTEAYTEQINTRLYYNKENKEKDRSEELWEKLKKAFKKKYVLTAGTINADIVGTKGLDPGHDYTLINIYTVKNDIKLVKLRNPYGNCEYSGDWRDSSDKWTPEIKKQCDFKGESDEGIFYMPYKLFLEYYDAIHICKIQEKYKTTYFKVSKNDAIKCQIHELVIKEDNPNTFIQLYQKNPRIIRKDGNYYPGNINSFIMLVDSEFKYIKSSSGKDTHIAIEVDLKPGKYYILSDVNYRNEYKGIQNSSYMITFYSPKQIKNCKNVSDRINVVSALELALYYYCKMNIKETINSNGIIIYDSKYANNELPFRVYCFKNLTNVSSKVRLDIKEKDINNFCIYNDNIASEFDNFVIKEIKPMNIATILVLDYNPKSQYEIENSKEEEEEEEPDYKFIKDNENVTYESEHPVFKNKGEKFDEDGDLLYFYSKTFNDKGYIIGLENTSEKSYRLNLNLKEVYDIDGDFNMKNNNIEFIILPKSRKVFNLRIKHDAKDPRFDFNYVK